MKDAVALRKIITSRKNELEQPSKVTPPSSAVRPVRVRTRGGTNVGGGLTATNGRSVSATIAALRGESEDEETTKMEPDEDSQTELPVL